MEFPTLSELLSENTVFVLGAGASKDYGFPLWKELCPMMLAAIRRREGTDEYASHNLRYWTEALALPESGLTVDTLAARADDNARRGFQQLMAEILLKRERADLEANKTGWIEVFLEKVHRLCSLRSPQQVLPKLAFVNLNYDRVLAQRMLPFIRRVFPDREWDRALFPGFGTDWRHHVHPHGNLGDLYYELDGRPYKITTSSTFLSFANIRDVEYGASHSWNQAPPPILPVDVAEPATWMDRAETAYVRANKLLSRAKHVVIIGVSPDGWSNAHLKLPPNARVWSVGHQPLHEHISSLGVYASDFARSLGVGDVGGEDSGFAFPQS